jgi:hypothetical protein
MRSSIVSASAGHLDESCKRWHAFDLRGFFWETDLTRSGSPRAGIISAVLERSSGGRRGKLEGLGEGLLAGSILLKLGPVGEWLGQEKQGLLAHGLPGSILHLVFHHRPAHRLAWAWQARSSRPFLVAAGVVACLVPVFALSSPFSL